MNLIRAATEEIRFAVIAIAKRVITIEDKIQIVKQIYDHRRVRHHQKTRGCFAAIDVLAPDVQRRSQYAAGFPTNRLFVFAPGLPDQTFAFAVEHVKHFFEQIALWFCLRAWRKFAKISDIDSFASDQIYVCAIHAGTETLPRLYVGFSQVTNIVVFVNRKVLLLQPLFPRIDVSLIPRTWPRRRSLRAIRVMVMMIVAVIVLVIDLAAATFSMCFSAQDRSRRQKAKPARCCALNEVATRDAAALEVSNPVFDLFHLCWPSLLTIRYDPVATARGSDSLSLLLRHARGHAMLFQIRFKHFSNHRIFVRVINHVAAGMKAHRIQAMCAPAATHSFDPVLAANPGCGHVFCRTLAGVEVLMKPAIWRHKQSSFRPIDAHFFRRFGILGNA